MERLVAVVQEMSLARDLTTLMAIVRSAARELVHADGATFVLRQGDLCHYADEDAITPLFKGLRFPMERCISGWSMLHRQAVVIEDIYRDARIPHDAYRPTFVKSLVMVPIRAVAPVGAIGTYWARQRVASPEEVRLLQALADSTSVAIENVHLYETLERRVAERTCQLEASRAELVTKNDALVQVQRQKEELAALIAHDLKNPATGIIMSSRARLRNPQLTDVERQSWKRVHAAADVITRMALDLLDVARAEDGRLATSPEPLELGPLLEQVIDQMTPLADAEQQSLEVLVDLRDDHVVADGELLRRVLQNVLDNALRHAPRGGTVTLRARDRDGALEIQVADTGPGVPSELRSAVFDKYACIENGRGMRGSGRRGLGLTFCRLAVEAHGGTIHVEDNVPVGSVFVIRLPRPSRSATGAEPKPGLHDGWPRGTMRA